MPGFREGVPRRAHGAASRRARRSSAPPTRRCGAPTCAGSGGSSAATGGSSRSSRVLIVIASLLGVIPAFLLRDIISKAFKPLAGGHVTVDMQLLTELVARR